MSGIDLPETPQQRRLGRRLRENEKERKRETLKCRMRWTKQKREK
jgi:hypothetical protein